MSDGNQRETGEPLSRRLRDAWMKTVGAYATDEKGTQGLLQRLVEFGALSAEEAKKVLGEARGKIDHNKTELDLRVDESIKGALDLQGYLVGPPLPPQAPLSPEGIEEVRRALVAIGAL